MDWGNNIYTSSANLHEGVQRIDADIRGLVVRLKADAVLVALSDPHGNWRKQVLPTYKANRSGR